MTTNIEQKFFEAFGIEDKEILNYMGNGFIEHTYKTPEITSDILLELICIVFNTFESFEINKIYTKETLKDKILQMLILAKDDVHKQVQSLFTEVGE